MSRAVRVAQIQTDPLPDCGRLDSGQADAAGGAAKKRLKPARLRADVEALKRDFGVSERRACKVTGFVRSTHRYKSRMPSQAALRMRLRELAMARPRYGYRRLTTLLLREGWLVNHKRVHRLYCQEGLQVRVKRRKKLASSPRVKPPAASRINERWSMDFMSDALADGRKIRLLTVIDIFTRECLALKVARSIPARSVTAALEAVIAERGPPSVIQVDNGTEFTSDVIPNNWSSFWGSGHCVSARVIDTSSGNSAADHAAFVGVSMLTIYNW